MAKTESGKANESHLRGAMPSSNESWEASSAKVWFFTTSDKMLSMATQNCNHFERLVYTTPVNKISERTHQASAVIFLWSHSSGETEVAGQEDFLSCHQFVFFA